MALFNTKRLVFYLLFGIGISLNSQTLQLNLSSAGTCVFSGQIYSFGIQEQNQNRFFCVYKINSSLVKSDSLSFPLSSKKGTETVNCWVDTLHDVLSFYVPEGQKQSLTLFRLNKKFELIAQKKEIEVSRINPLSGFDNELYYENKNVYAVKTKYDSAGAQFFLNKYSLKESSITFEYDFPWQFPFERRNIGSAKVIFANTNYVFLFVMVKSGAKTGQWILKVNAKSGELLKGTKLNLKAEEFTYTFGNAFFETKTKTLLLCGSKFTSVQLPPNAHKLAISGQTFCTLYVIELDSIGDVSHRKDFKLPVLEPKLNGKKNKTHHLFYN